MCNTKPSVKKRVLKIRIKPHKRKDLLRFFAGV